MPSLQDVELSRGRTCLGNTALMPSLHPPLAFALQKSPVLGQTAPQEKCDADVCLDHDVLDHLLALHDDTIQLLVARRQSI
jgi:hypothetical protein